MLPAVASSSLGLQLALIGCHNATRVAALALPLSLGKPVGATSFHREAAAMRRQQLEKSSQQAPSNNTVASAIKEDPGIGAALRSRWPYLVMLGAAASGLLAYSVVREPTVTQQCYLDIDVDGEPAGRIVVGLFGNDTPQTTQNFLALASHTRGFGYRNTPIHRAMHGFTIFGGDVTAGDGSGGVSVFGPSFGVENMAVRHRRGTLSMALDEQGRVRSQWFISLVTAPALDRKAVAFGKVLSGLEVADAISRLPVDEQHRPKSRVLVRDSGVLLPQQ